MPPLLPSPEMAVSVIETAVAVAPDATSEIRAAYKAVFNTHENRSDLKWRDRPLEGIYLVPPGGSRLLLPEILVPSEESDPWSIPVPVIDPRGVA